MQRVFTIVVLGCSASTAPVAKPPPRPTAVTEGAGTVEAAPRKLAPAGDGVEILVTNTEGASDLVVTDDTLYWIGGGHFDKQDIYRAPHQRDAKPSLVFDAPEGADELVLVGDRLAWSQPTWSIVTMPRAGGTPSELVRLDDAPSHMLDRDGLVVAAYEPGETGDARVFRVSERGEVTSIAKLRGGQSPKIAFDPKGELYIATDNSGGWARRRTVMVGRVVEGKVVPVVKPPTGATLVAADADAIYYSHEDNLVDTIYRLPTGATKPQRLAKNHDENGSITALAVDEHYVYWGEYVTGTTNGKLWRMPKTGGPPQAIADCGETTRLVFYGPDLYWADARLNRIARIRR